MRFEAVCSSGWRVWSHADVRLHLVRYRALSSMTAPGRRLNMPRTILTRHHPALSTHSRQFSLFLKVLELRVACIVHRRLFRVTAGMTALPFAYGIITIEYRGEVTLPRWIRSTKVCKPCESRGDCVHLIDGIRAVSRRGIVRIGRGIRGLQHRLLRPQYSMRCRGVHRLGRNSRLIIGRRRAHCHIATTRPWAWPLRLSRWSLLTTGYTVLLYLLRIRRLWRWLRLVVALSVLLARSRLLGRRGSVRLMRLLLELLIVGRCIRVDSRLSRSTRTLDKSSILLARLRRGGSGVGSLGRIESRTFC
jgi:hypothetical protein